MAIYIFVPFNKELVKDPQSIFIGPKEVDTHTKARDTATPENYVNISIGRIARILVRTRCH